MQLIITSASFQIINTGAAIQNVITVSAIEIVTALQTRQGVIPAIPKNNIATEAANQRVITCAAIHLLREVIHDLVVRPDGPIGKLIGLNASEQAVLDENAILIDSIGVSKWEGYTV